MTEATALPKQMLQSLVPWLGARRWLVGYSGGLDSSVLLHLLADIAQQCELPSLVAVHVNHQLQPAADAWQRQCNTVCSQLSIEFVALAVTVDKPSRTSLEDAARTARYAAFESVMQPGDVLLLAQHADDQAETFLLRALRGAGVAGLAAMPFSRAFAGGTLVRPLLRHDRACLQSYADAKAIAFVDDPSNADTHFDRNFLRNTILPQLKTRWPQAHSRLAAAARHLAQADALLNEVAQQDLQLCDMALQWGAPSIALMPLATLTPARRRNALRAWLAQLLSPGRGKPLVLSEVQLEQLEQQWFDAREDAMPCIAVGGIELRRYRDRGFCVMPLPPVAGGRWDLHEPLPIAGLGTLRAEQGAGGLRTIEQVDVRFRGGGEIFCSDGGHHQPLKQWLQEHGVPPWLRDHLPLLFYRDELVAIADIAIAPAWRVAADQPGWQIRLT